MKILIRIFLCLIITTQFAFASVASELKQAIDEYYYAITVEWNQKDEEFLEQQNEVLNTKISLLMKDGISIEDLKEAFPSLNINKIEHDLLQVNTKDQSSINEFIKKTQAEYKKGASWNGEVIGAGIAIAVGIYLVVNIVLALNKRANSSNPHQPVQLFPSYVDE
jgi:hypothetical protein